MADFSGFTSDVASQPAERADQPSQQAVGEQSAIVADGGLGDGLPISTAAGSGGSEASLSPFVVPGVGAASLPTPAVATGKLTMDELKIVPGTFKELQQTHVKLAISQTEV